MDDEEVAQSVQEAYEKIALFERNTTSRFSIAWESKSFSDIDVNSGPSGKFKIYWELRSSDKGVQIPYDGVPFTKVGFQIRNCMHGPERHAAHKEKYKLQQTKVQENDHAGKSKKRRCLLQPTKKMDCPATISLRAIIKYPQFKIEGSDSVWKRKQKSKLLKEELLHSDIEKHLKVHVAFPKHDLDHKNHITSEFSGFSQSLDETIIAKIHSLVHDGVRSVAEMKRHLRLFVLGSIPSGNTISEFNRRYYPSNRDIRNHMYRALRFCQFSTEDQENLIHMVKEWEAQRPDDKFFYRPNCAENEESSEPDGNGEVSARGSTLLFVYQTKWQQNLLLKYGGEICLLDATYNTSKYDLPLFFLCVHTNVGFTIVASFVVANENRENIQDGLLKIQEWNPCWKPRHFLTDFDEREIWAAENSFADCETFLCDFHREQAWGRWLKDSKHGLADVQSEVMKLLRSIAHSNTENEYKMNVETLKKSAYWKNNAVLQNWFQGRWLNNAKRWVQFYRSSLLNIRVTTTNGLERQHYEFKKRHLANYTDGSLSSMLSILVSNFLPESYTRYVQYNIQSMGEYRKYSTDIPSFLKNRPKFFLEHCMKRIPPVGSYLPQSSIETLPNGEFKIESTESDRHYIVNLENDLPCCSCPDWKRTHLPCKHMLSIFFHFPAHSWEFLQPAYTECPHFKVDSDILKSCLTECVSDNETTEVNLDNVTVTEQETQTMCMERSLKEKKVRNNAASVRLQCIQLVKQLSSSIYLVPHQQSLLPLHEKLEEAATLVKEYLPHENGLPLRSTSLALKREYRKKYRSLPSRRKRGRAAVTKKKIDSKISKVHAIRGKPFSKKRQKRLLKQNSCDEKSSKSERIPVQSSKIQAEETERIVENVNVKASRISYKPKRKICVSSRNKSGSSSCTQSVVEEDESTGHGKSGVPSTTEDSVDFSLVDSIWAQKPVGHLCSRIGHYKLSDRSFYCLRTMLPDEIIDAYTYLLSSSQENKRVYHVSCSVMTAIFNGNAELHQYLSEVPKLDDFDVICGALNEGSCHWCLIYIMPKEQVLFYLNPLGESFSRLQRIEEKWKDLLFGRENIGIVESPTEWFVHTKEHARQTDSTSCGVLVLKFLECMLTGADIQTDTSARGILYCRKYVGQILLKNSDDLDIYCRHCYTKESQERGALVRCRLCKENKYFHATCGCSLHPAVQENNDQSQNQNKDSLEYNLRKDPQKKRKRSSYIYPDLRGRLFDLMYGFEKRGENSADVLKKICCLCMLAFKYFIYATCLKSRKQDTSPDQSLTDSVSWLYESVQAHTEQCKKLVNALCHLCPGRVLIKGTANVLGHKISVLYDDHIKAKIKEVLGLKEGNSSCYEPHWRHIRWVKRQPLNEALELRNSEKGIEERAKLFGKGLKEFHALILEEFGVFKPKSIIRIGYCHGHYLSLKEDRNKLLMATLEDEMGQNMNEGIRYFRDVLFVEAEILLASVVWNFPLLEAERRLYPKKS